MNNMYQKKIFIFLGRITNGNLGKLFCKGKQTFCWKFSANNKLEKTLQSPLPLRKSFTY